MDDKTLTQKVAEATNALNEAMNEAHKAGIVTQVAIRDFQNLADRSPRKSVVTQCMRPLD